MTASKMQVGTYRTSIVFDDRAREFAMYVNGDLCGYAKTQDEAETVLSQLVGDLIAENWYGATGPATDCDRLDLLNLAARIAATHKATYAASAERRGWIAGMREAANIMCADCRKGAPLEYGDRHFYGGTPQLCPARKIHAILIAEEAARG